MYANDTRHFYSLLDDRGSLRVTAADRSDLAQILSLQKEAYVSEAEIYDDYSIPPLHQSQEDIEGE